MSVTIDGISVVIPNYNGQRLLPAVIPPALEALGQTGLPWELVVVDDGSTDESLSILARDFPQVTCLRNEVNAGFSVTANKGIRAARFSWVLLLNSDVKLEPGYFAPLLKYTRRPGVFGVMGRIVGWEDDIIQDGARFPYCQGAKIKTSGQYLLAEEEAMREGIYSMYISGANSFFNRELFLALGGFNELFSPYYAEDTELSFRAWRLGYTCWYDHFAICRHRVSATIATHRKKKQVNVVYNRNKMFLHAIHLSRPARLLWMSQLVAEVLVKTLVAKWDYTRSFFLFLKNYAGVRQSRRVISQLAVSRGLRTVPDFFKLITDSLRDKTFRRL